MIISLLIRKVLLNKPRRAEDEPDDFQEQAMSVFVLGTPSNNNGNPFSFDQTQGFYRSWSTVLTLFVWSGVWAM